MMVLAIDPGPTHSAWVVLDGGHIVAAKKQSNEVFLEDFRTGTAPDDLLLVVEMVASYGMPVGAEIFDTCVVIGRILEAWGDDASSTLMFRREVKLHLCGQARAKDSNIRQALIDRFGGKQATKKGGVLHGISGDVWSALAVAVTYADGAARKAA